MSDDEVYVGSPYDDYDDYWDDDQAQDLADDLAQHAAYSPVWQETPLGELDPYHSDWEYYSDDYYDDDPVLLVQNTLDGNGQHAIGKAQRLQRNRGKKRKLDEAREFRDVDTETKSLMNSIQGTVWAQEQEDPTAVFKRGDQKTVALLTNWRDLFGVHDRALPDAGWSQAHRDETWANDMGLAAMGLLQQREQRNIQGQSGIEDNTTLDDDEESVDDADDVDNDAVAGQELIVSDQDSRMAREIPETGEVLQKMTLATGPTVPEDDHDHDGRVRKRRKQQNLPSPPTSTESVSLQAAISQSSGKDAFSSSTNSPRQARKNTPDPTETQKVRNGSEGFSRQLSRASASESKKRKASPGIKDTNSEYHENTERSLDQRSVTQSLNKKRKKTAAQGSSPARRSQRLKKEAV